MAPRAGVITSRSVEPGEVVTPGREVLTLSELATVDLKIFVDETQIGKVKPGQKAEVRVDTFPERTFAGMVTFISPEGEFTPKIIQTQKERVKLVYLVKVSIPTPPSNSSQGCPPMPGYDSEPYLRIRGSPAVSAPWRRSATSPSRSGGERSSASSARTGRGNPPSSGWRRRCSNPPPAGSRSAAWTS